MRAIATAIFGTLCAVGPVLAQAPEKPRTLGSVMIENPERKRAFLIGLAEGLSAKYPHLRLSELTRCLEDAADLPVNWPKDLRPFALGCAANPSAR
ncbi:hypothetical protein PQI07_06500 [Methylobacterium sp. 092160098-2]|uniref:hypothetical protein n=1 Tax=Methylobacterium sp. 092160098-2 TaxID=3025129 RepID=UPI002381B5DE|nr:hypothetical protein [Methylobacterium sp. 092160098-2]MDE4910351.1 hypothetical protein [Methylobacterium sp. 092160098-2]